MTKPTIPEIRRAVADYMRSEGCSCCRGGDHDQHAEKLAKLLNVPEYDDGSGYDFARFQSKRAASRR
jgi:hypothetical protein